MKDVSNRDPVSRGKTSLISPLDPAAAEPYYRQIYGRFRDAIASGLLRPGDRVPSARALTQELGLARGTIDAAYSLLTAEGYFEARGQAGTIVTPSLKPRAPVARAKPSVSLTPTSTSFRPESILWPDADMLVGTTMGIVRRQLQRTGVPQRTQEVRAADVPSLKGAVVMNSWSPGIAVTSLDRDEILSSPHLLELLHHAFRNEEPVAP